VCVGGGGGGTSTERWFVRRRINLVGGKFCHDARCRENSVKRVSVILQAVSIGRMCTVIYI